MRVQALRPSVVSQNWVRDALAISPGGYKRLTGRQDFASRTVVRVERAILREAQNMLNDLRRELDAKVAALVTKRLAPLDPVEALIFLREYVRGDLS